MRTMTMTLGAALIAVSATLHADPVADPVEELFNELDADNDGKLSWQESSSYANLKNYFTSLDANQDGYLTPFEFGVSPRAHS
ncbi:EF-hand domain-containing protein [Marinobacterium rhizophilum]|uniref:EF-hand domain-containing protein n=1 Tax=Marinobacterium rhizophilum TaxID=420402 RepID=UPI000377093F|nr:EF-hand domain-containing protein [Marinobacterium rhizophilum]